MIDFRSAYLNRTIQEDIYMHALPGYLKKDQKGMVMKLHKGQYGLKQARLAWYEDLKHTMVSKLGFTCYGTDRGVFYNHNNEECVTVGISVDDSLVVGSLLMVIKKFKSNTSKHYDISDLGNIHFLLRFEIKCDLKV